MNTPLFQKLNLKQQEVIYVINAPDSMTSELKAIGEWYQVKTQLPRSPRADFLMVFVYEQSEIEKMVSRLVKVLSNDPILWMTYPKKSSKKYTSDISRDHSWQPLGDIGMEGVRIVAVDDDWSALRFRYVKHIKKMSRHKGMILSTAGMEKTSGK